MNLVRRELKSYQLETKPGSFHSKPHRITSRVFANLLEFNPNNLGDWSARYIPGKHHTPTRTIERSVIKKLITLYGGSLSTHGGYATTGATESNLYSTWMGRKFLEQRYPRNQICLIKTSLTHYSVTKAADVVGTSSFVTPLNHRTWTLDPINLRQTTKRLKSRGFLGFLLPLTLGYTQTGTNDNIEAILKTTDHLSQTLKVHFFIWVDAALNGLVLPFSRLNFSPLSNPQIQTVSLDFHKFGMSPIPSAVVLHKKPLINLIKRPIPYLQETDSTLLGSRSGLPAVTMAATISLLGKSGFTQRVKSAITKKNLLIDTITKQYPQARIVTDPHSVSFGIAATKPLTPALISLLGLFAKRHRYLFDNGIKTHYLYKSALLNS